MKTYKVTFKLDGSIESDTIEVANKSTAQRVICSDYGIEKKDIISCIESEMEYTQDEENEMNDFENGL